MSQDHLPRPPAPRVPRPTHNQGQTHERPIPLYQVVLQHDADKDLMFIVHSVMDLTHYCRAEAMHRMWQAHHYGRSLLLATYKERAELYVEQFAERGLRVTIEPAS